VGTLLVGEKTDCTRGPAVAHRTRLRTDMAAFSTLLFFAAVSITVVASQNSVSEDCLVGEDCIGIRSCTAVVQQLQRAKATQDATKRNEIIQSVRDKVCGKRKERRVCCASSEPLQTFTQQAAAPVPKKIGTFTNIFHDIAGTAYALNETTILIKGFNYDGEGPDAFFLGGTHGRPSKSGEVVMPYPFEGRHFNYRDKNIPILGRFNGNKDVVLHLPPGTTVDQLKWISVWCRDYTVNFGHVNVPSNFVI